MPNGFDGAERRISGEERKEDERERLREGAQWQLCHGVGVAERGNAAVRQRGPEDGIDEDIHLGRGQAERDRKHQPADFSNARIVEAQGGGRAPAGPPECRELHAEMQQGAGNHPNGQCCHAVAGCENGSRHDDRAVVEKRRERLRQESLIGGQDADHHPARPEKDRLEQQDPGQANDDLVIVRAVAEGD